MNSQEIEQSLVLAEHYFRNNNYKLAEEILKKITHLDKLNPKANELLAYIYGNQGQTSFSFDLLSIASKHPNCSPEALYYLGSSLLQQKKFDKALEFLTKSLDKAGDFFEGLHDAGTACAQLGKKEEALAFYLKASKYNNNYPELFFNIGRIYDEFKLFEKAVLFYDKALQINPNHPQTLLNKSISLKYLEKHDEALASIKHLTKLYPSYPEAWGNQGAILNELENYEEAVNCLKKAILLKPNYPEALSNLGAALNNLQKANEALEYLNSSIELDPNNSEAWSNRGASFNQLKMQSKALENLDHAIDINPNLVEAWANKAIVLNELKKTDEAINCCEKAIQLDPKHSKAIHNKSLILLALKKYSEALDLYESRLKVINFEFPLPLSDLPLWDGTRKDSKLLIVGEQGIGDEIFYSRFLQHLESENTITVIMDRRLVKIMSRSFPKINFIAKGAPLDPESYSHQIPIGSLPKIISNQLGTLPYFNEPFLIPIQQTSNDDLDNLNYQNNLICGLSWKSANKKMGGDKSIDLPKFNSFLKFSKTTYINLQYGEVSKEINEVKSQLGVDIAQVNGVDLFEDIDGLLSIIDTCDIIVTTSNVTAHLAGAIGKKTLLLAPYAQGRIWYWHDHEVSIWYPSIKQYFQDADLSWDNAINKIAAELEQEIARKN